MHFGGLIFSPTKLLEQGVTDFSFIQCGFLPGSQPQAGSRYDRVGRTLAQCEWGQSNVAIELRVPRSSKIMYPQLIMRTQIHTSRPCWWWMPLLASGAEGISIPDTVTLAPSFLLDEAGASADRGHGGSKTRASVAKSQLTTTAAAAGSRRMALLWAFSGSGPATDSRGTDSTISKTLGGIAVDGELSDAEVASSHAVGLGQDELEARRDRRLPAAAVASPLQRLHSQTLVGDESMLCAARAICECGRRGGGGAGGDLGGGERSKLPLAVLKIWGRESEEERGRQRSLAGEEQRLKRRGRRLRVVSGLQILETRGPMVGQRAQFGITSPKASLVQRCPCSI